MQLLPDRDGQEGVAVTIALPEPTPPSECWQVPSDFEVRANGYLPVELDVAADGHTVGGCAATPQTMVARFDIPITPQHLAIVFSTGGSRVSVDVTRPVPGPVDVTVPAAAVDRRTPFPVTLRADEGSFPTGSECWTAVFGWVKTERFESARVNAMPSATGLELSVGFPAELDVPTGAAVLQLLTVVGNGCEPPPTVACPNLAGCTVERVYGRRLGPFSVTFQ